jgi:hypothetical protein
MQEAAAHVQTQPRIAPRAGLRRILRQIAWSLPALPVAVLGHELGHMVWLKLFRFDGVRLHFGAVSYLRQDDFWRLARHGRLDEAAQVVPLMHIGTATATGIAVSYATLLGCAYLSRGRDAHPFVFALGLAAALRFRIGIEILPRLLTTADRSPSGTDEGLVSAVSGIPEALLWGVGLTVTAASWYVLFRALPRDSRVASLGSAIAGIALGAIAYVGWLGPLLLPY